MCAPGLDITQLKQISIHAGVDLWYARMDEYSPASFLSFLSEDEKERALKIRDSVISGYAVISRGVLRVLLGRYLEKSPASVVIKDLSNGKPILASGAYDQLSFNVSHSREVLSIAVSPGNPVGLDIEKVDPRTNPGQAASIAFSAEEKSFLENSENLSRDFYKIWTAKEAILKATGDGFAYPSRNFSVISSNNSSILRCISGAVTSNRRCEIHPFSIFEDFIGSLAVMYP